MSSGYDPDGVVNVFRRITNKESVYRPYLFDYLESHPVSQERITRIGEALDSLEVDKYQVSEGDQKAFLEASNIIRSSIQSPAA